MNDQDSGIKLLPRISIDFIQEKSRESRKAHNNFNHFMYASRVFFLSSEEKSCHYKALRCFMFTMMECAKAIFSPRLPFYSFFSI